MADTAFSTNNFAPTATTSCWPENFDRIPDQNWVYDSVDELGIRYDRVGEHGWYTNLDPTVAQALSTLGEHQILLDYSGGTGILTRRILSNIRHPVGVLNVDASAKFLRVALENSRHDQRVAFRLLDWLADERRLQQVDEALEQPILDRGVDVLTSTNAIHLYQDLNGTLGSWRNVLRDNGIALISSANIRNPASHEQDWILDETVAKVNDIAADIVEWQPAFEEYRDVLRDSSRMAAHTKLREKVFVPVRPLDMYLDACADTGMTVLHTFTSTVHARVHEWGDLLATYHDGVLSWIGGSRKVEGTPPTERAVRDRQLLIRYSLERLFGGQTSFPCTWTYITCRP